MTDLDSQNNSITVNVSSGGNMTNISTTYDSSIYYSNIAREWAISNKLIDNEDYSSKYYANESKKQAQAAADKAEEVKENTNTALSDINSAKTNSLNSISEQESIAVNNINSIGNIQVNLAVQQANIATQKAEEAAATVNNAITSITNQETMSKNNVIDTASEQVELIQAEAQAQISNIEQTGFYINNGKLYYVDANGQEQEFEFDKNSDTIPLFTGHYFDFKPNHPSWLKAETQQNSGGIYTSCYETLVSCLTETNNIYNLKVIETSAMEEGVDYSEYWKINQEEMWFKTPVNIGISVSTTAQLYFKVTNAVQNLELLDAGEVLETLADKQDKCIHITETYVNSTSWYRIWSDGWCEQGGISSFDGIHGQTCTINLLKNLQNTDYTIVRGGTEAYKTSSLVACTITNKTTSSFDVYYTAQNGAQYPVEYNWIVYGYLTEGEN